MLPEFVTCLSFTEFYRRKHSQPLNRLIIIPGYLVGIATGYGLDDRRVGIRVPVGSRIFSSPRRQDRLWGPPSHLSSGYRGLFPRRESIRGVKLTTHQLVQGSRKCGCVHPLPHMPSWPSAELVKHRDNSTFIIIRCCSSVRSVNAAAMLNSITAVR
jgi:hypothetical protein